jgi:hypothetical protein
MNEMKPDDKEALNELLRGVAFGIGVVGLLVLLSVIFGEWGEKPQEPQQSKGNFTVVDQYKGCDVVQWHYGPLAEYKYFLHCNNTRPVYEK